MAQAKRFSVASGTAPSADEALPPATDTPAAPPAPQGPAQRAPRASLRPQVAVDATPPPAEMPKARRQRWIFALDAAFGKAGAARDDYTSAMEEVTQLVAEARQAGVPEHLIESAAMRKDVEIPPES